MQSRSLPPVAGKGILLNTPIMLMPHPDESKPCQKPAEPATNSNHSRRHKIITPLVTRRPRAATGRAPAATLHPGILHADLPGPACHGKNTDLPRLKWPPQSGAQGETWLLGENHPFPLLCSLPLPSPLLLLLSLPPQLLCCQLLHLHLPSPHYWHQWTRSKRIVQPNMLY